METTHNEGDRLLALAGDYVRGCFSNPDLADEIDAYFERAPAPGDVGSQQQEREPFAYYVVPIDGAGARFVFKRPMDHPSQRITPLYAAPPVQPPPCELCGEPSAIDGHMCNEPCSGGPECDGWGAAPGA
jgi:hypothetical protein